GMIHITRNHGKSWENITPPGLAKHSRISIIDASRHKAGTAYVAVKRYQMNDREPYIFKTDDYGKTWKKIVSGIPAGSFVHAVREDITKPGLLYAGTEHGMMVSYDDGEYWNPLQLNLPNTQVSDIVVTEKDIAIATHGRSMYILDDISPIREFAPEIAQKPVHLFKPYYAVRKVQNAVFAYYLNKDADKLKIEILDPDGKVIQSFDGEKPKQKSGEADGEADDDEFAVPAAKAPTMTKGLNVFNWDLRYPGAKVFKGMILWSARPQNGPIAPPGQYQVRITTAGETLSQPFEIRVDPRIKNVTVADLQEQFKLATKIRDETSKANEAVIKIRSLKEKMKKAGFNDPGIISKLNGIEETLYQVKNKSNQDPLNFPIKLNNKMGTLQRIVESGEAKPTDDSYKVFDELSSEINKQVEDLNNLMKTKTIKKFASGLTI
uniref:hypothetical protein n=1 Tax=Arcticibacter sp. TaxID=1872630 RepID=UPI00388E54E9